jgi:6-phosphogluconolactonase
MTRALRLLALTLVVAFVSVATSAEPLRVYVGTYTDKHDSKGIYVLDFDPATGHATEPRLAAAVSSPSFLAIHPTNKYLYAVSESGKTGTVTAYALQPDGTLKELNHQTTGGNGPCFVSTDPTGRVAMVANYGSGSFESLPINDDGSLAEPSAFVQDKGQSVNKQRQEGPHAHSMNPDPAGRFAFGCDLGLDAVFRFPIDTAARKIDTAQVARTNIKPGSGPRHLAFTPDAKHVYVVSEMASTVTAFSYNAADGSLTELQTISTLPPDFHGESTCAEIQVHPSGKFVYASNRGHDSIAVFTVDPATGRLTATGQTKTGGKTPRNFRLDPAGNWLLAENQNSGTINVFKVDPTTGALTVTDTTIHVGSPVCVKFVPMGK